MTIANFNQEAVRLAYGIWGGGGGHVTPPPPNVTYEGERIGRQPLCGQHVMQEDHLGVAANADQVR